MGKVILIVEDDPKSIKLTRDILTVSGYATLEATDGKQGVALARDKKPDLILMDIQLPIMDGLEAAKILKSDAETKDIPIIALTASAMKGDEEKVYEAGCEEYITKPFEISTLLKKVAEHLSK